MPPPPTGIAADPVLAEHGLEQAEELGAHMKKLSASTPIKHIYVSPFYRCLQTVQPTAKNLGLKVFVEHGVSEWLSRPNYTESPKPASTKVLSEKFFPGLIDESYVPIISESVVGETYEELLARAKNFVSKLIERLDNEYPDVESIMIVTHAATKIVLGRAIVKDDNLAVRTGTCSLDTYVRDDKDSTKWTAEKIGDASFLTNGEEMHWSFGMAMLFLTKLKLIFTNLSFYIYTEIAYAPGSTEDIAARLQASDGQTVSFDKPDDSSNTNDGKQKEEMVVSS